MHDRLLLYRHEIQEAFPNLTVHTLRLIDDGQSNDVVVMDEEVIFRFPRYAGMVDAVRREASVLQRLQGRLPLPIPDPIYVCMDDAVPGRAFIGYSALPGEPLHRNGLEDSDCMESAAGTLAGFLRAFHDIPPEAVLGPEDLDRDPAVEWEQFVTRVRDLLAPAMEPDRRDRVLTSLEHGLDLVRTSAPPRVLLHGDLGASNVLYSPSERDISGVIDFASVHVGDPAVDLAAASTIGPRFFVALCKQYPGAAEMLDRVRFYRGTFALQEALFGLEHGDEAAYRAGMEGYLPVAQP